MDSGLVTFLLIVAFVLWLIAFFAVVRLFSINATLKAILLHLKSVAPASATKEPAETGVDRLVEQARWRAASWTLVIGVVVGIVILMIIGLSK